MKKPVLSLVLFSFVAGSPSLPASSPDARISAALLPAWIHRNEIKINPAPDTVLSPGDHIITGQNGRIEISLQSNVLVRLYPESEIAMTDSQSAQSDDADDAAQLVIHNGKTCFEYRPVPEAHQNFSIVSGNTTVTATMHPGYVCLLRRDELSSIHLRDGSVRITHAIDPNMVILSDKGTHFRIDDDASFELLVPGIADMTDPATEPPFIVQPESGIDIVSDAPEMPGHSKQAVATDTDKPPPQPTDIRSGSFVYTVYLFSTRSEQIARQVSDKFLAAGHPSEIIVSRKDSPIRYRVAVSGFESLQAARDYSQTVVGTLGIADTWIGKTRR